jgi:hypothetical protein
LNRAAIGGKISNISWSPMAVTRNPDCIFDHYVGEMREPELALSTWRGIPFIVQKRQL